MKWKTRRVSGDNFDSSVKEERGLVSWSYILLLAESDTSNCMLSAKSGHERKELCWWTLKTLTCNPGV